MNFLTFLIILLFTSQTLQYPFPKQFNLILNKKIEQQVSSKEITDEKSIVLKETGQETGISYSVFTKQKVPLQKGLNLRAIAQLPFYYLGKTTDGLAIIIQNHPDGNKYIGDHGIGLGTKSINEKCAGLIIKAYQIYDLNKPYTERNSYMNISFADQVIYTQRDLDDSNIQKINLKIQILENDEALLTFAIGDDYQTGPQQPLKLNNFRKGLCLQEKEDLSAFVGFSASQYTQNFRIETEIQLFKIADYDCGCPSDDSFPLNIYYKKDYTSIKADEDLYISIEEPRICNECDDFQGQERDIYLLIDYTWKIKGKKIISDNNKAFIEFQLPFISGNNEQSNQHVMSILVDEISFAQKQFSIVPNSFLQEKWFVPFTKKNLENDISKSSVPLTGFSYTKATQPPNIPPLDDKAKQALNLKQEKSYIVDVYSRPIIKRKSEYSFLEFSNERIKIDSIKNIVENSDSIVQVKEWIPTKEINIQTDKYVLQGQSYEYEIKHEDGTLIQLIKTQPEISLDILYDGACYGNYCTSFFCKKSDQDDLPPVSELDKVCKEMDDSEYLGLDIFSEVAEQNSNNLIKFIGSKISKFLALKDLYYIGKVYKAKCPEYDIDCKTAKFMIIGKAIINQISIVGKVNMFFDLLTTFADGSYYLASKLGQFVTTKFAGDPHIKNLDGCNFDFQGQGDFVLLEEKLIGFAIHSRFLQNSRFQHATTINSIAIRGFWGSPLVQFESLIKDKEPLIRINGLIIKIENRKIFEISNLKIRCESENYFIEFSNGIQLQVTNHGYGFLWTGFATIPAVYSGKLQGILGNGDSEDNQSDFLAGNNSQIGYEIIKSCKEAYAENIWKFGQSWRLTKKEDSILFYRKDENPNSFFDEKWKPISSQELIKQADQKIKDKAENQCQQFKWSSKEDYQNCFFDVLLFQTNDKNQLEIANAYYFSKEVPQKGQVQLIYKNIGETSAELEFGFNKPLEQLCSQGCNSKILLKKEGESEFKDYLKLQNTSSQKTIQKISGLDKHTQYTFKVQVNDYYDTFQSNQVSLFTLKDICVPYCEKQNACGDDGCGGQCVSKVECTTECKFGVCKVKEKNNEVKEKNGEVKEKNGEAKEHNGEEKEISEENEENSETISTLAIILISVSVTILLIIIVVLIYFYRRKMLRKKKYLPSTYTQQPNSCTALQAIN